MGKSSIPNTVLPYSYLCGRNFSDFVTARVVGITEDGRQRQFGLNIGTVFTRSHGDVLIPSGSQKRSHSNPKVLWYVLGTWGPF